MTTQRTPTRKPNNAHSPWRKGPHCDTKRAQASYARYRRQGEERR